jgi:mannose-6-phosphate isomerase-like protein (cupin superfamily)
VPIKPKKVKKPWGWELWFAHSKCYVGKVIFIKKGHRLSLQYHRRKHETVYTHEGRWLLILGKSQRRMKPGDSVVIAPGRRHRFCAPYGDVRLLEVSTPQVKDVVRLEDDYGRIKKATSAMSATTATAARKR